jgi:hypothetical protein
MGVSTDAILFWGIVSDEEGHPWLKHQPEDDEDDDDDDSDDDSDDDEFDWEEVYAEAMGVPCPDAEYGDDTKPIYQAYWKRKREIIEASGCTFGSHCSGDCPMDYVAVVESETTARRGYPEEITSLEVKPDWEPKLREFCEKLNIPWGEPKWWLVSYWG